MSLKTTFHPFLAFLILEEVSSPSQHIPIDRPVLERCVIGIGAGGGYIGIAIDSEIDHREVFQAFLIAFRLLECFSSEKVLPRPTQEGITQPEPMAAVRLDSPCVRVVE